MSSMQPILHTKPHTQVQDVFYPYLVQEFSKIGQIKTAPALEEEKQKVWAGEGRVLPLHSSYFRHQGTGCSLLWYF